MTSLADSIRELHTDANGRTLEVGDTVLFYSGNTASIRKGVIKKFLDPKEKVTKTLYPYPYIHRGTITVVSDSGESKLKSGAICWKLEGVQ